MNETKEKNKSTFSVDVVVGTRQLIVVVALVLFTYFAFNTAVTNWYNFLIQSAIVIGGLSILLIVYERAQGNIFDLPQAPYKEIFRTIMKIILATVAIGIGLVFFLLGVGWMYSVSPIWAAAYITMTLLIVGIGAVCYGLVVLYNLSVDDEDNIPLEYVQETGFFLPEVSKEQRALVALLLSGAVNAIHAVPLEAEPMVKSQLVDKEWVATKDTEGIASLYLTDIGLKIALGVVRAYEYNEIFYGEFSPPMTNKDYHEAVENLTGETGEDDE